MLLGHQAAVDRVHRHPVEEGEPLEMGGSLIHGPGQGCLRRVVQYLLEQLRKPGLCHIHLYGLSTGDAPWAVNQPTEEVATAHWQAWLQSQESRQSPESHG